MAKSKRSRPKQEPKPAAHVVGTRAEAAKLVKEQIGKGSVRTLADWLKLGCPGKPGHYDIDAIVAWCKDNVDVEGESENADEKNRSFWAAYRVREEALRSEIKRKREKGELIEVSVGTQLIMRLAGELSTVLEQLPDWVLTLMPAKTPAAHKRKARERMAKKVDDMRSTVADTIEEWKTE